ncbi:MAG: hypothetical protein ACYDHU_10865 [Acidimicrobiales bacterium]
MLAEKLRSASHRSHAVVVFITTTSVNSAYVQPEVGTARECGKPLMAIVGMGSDSRTRGILHVMEHLELSIEHPAEPPAKSTAWLQPLVLNQPSVDPSTASVTQSSAPDPATAFRVVGLSLILGVPTMVVLSHGSGNG